MKRNTQVHVMIEIRNVQSVQRAFVSYIDGLHKERMWPTKKFKKYNDLKQFDRKISVILRNPIDIYALR